MEGAAVAQVCREHGVPFACIRTISDTADEHMHASLPEFLGGLAAAYTAGIVRCWLGAGGVGTAR
jgi:adenosylhomocysteine nucleosidase